MRRKMIHWPCRLGLGTGLAIQSRESIENCNRRNQTTGFNGLSGLSEAGQEQTGVEDLRRCPLCQRVLRVVRKCLSFQTEVYWEMHRIILSSLSSTISQNDHAHWSLNEICGHNAWNLHTFILLNYMVLPTESKVVAISYSIIHSATGNYSSVTFI